MEVQIDKVLASLRAIPDAMGKAVFLQGLQDRNETLFYRILVENIQELAPIIYTPTVGQMCQKFGATFKKTRGMYFSTADKVSDTAAGVTRASLVRTRPHTTHDQRSHMCASLPCAPPPTVGSCANRGIWAPWPTTGRTMTWM